MDYRIFSKILWQLQIMSQASKMRWRSISSLAIRTSLEILNLCSSKELQDFHKQKSRGFRSGNNRICNWSRKHFKLYLNKFTNTYVHINFFNALVGSSALKFVTFILVTSLFYLYICISY